MNRTSMAILVGLLAGIGGGLATHFIVGGDTTTSDVTLPGGTVDFSAVVARLDRIESAMTNKPLSVEPELRGSGHVAAAANATDAQLEALAARIEERLKPAMQETVKASLKEAMASGDRGGMLLQMDASEEVKKKRVALAVAAAELGLSSDEEEAVRRIGRESTDKFFEILADEGESADDIRREFEDAKGDTTKRSALRSKYIGRLLPKMGELITFGLEHDGKMKKAVGAEKAKKLKDGYQLTDLDPLGLETIFEFD